MTGQSTKHEERRDDLAAYALGALDAARGRRGEDAPRRLRGLRRVPGVAAAGRRPAAGLGRAGRAARERLRESLMATVRAEAAAERAAPAPQPNAPRRRWSWAGSCCAPRPASPPWPCSRWAPPSATCSATPAETGRDVVQAQAVGIDSRADALAASVEHGAGGDAILHVQRAPALDKGDVYQAWVSRGGTMEPAASFRPREDGTAEAALGDSLEGADAVLVTEEPTAERGAADLAADPARRPRLTRPRAPV